METGQRIECEIKRLSGLFKDVPSEQRQIALNLIQRVAFMQITLEDMEEDIKTKGTLELSRTLPRKLRERPVVKMYNAMLKNYTSTMKQLLAGLPSQNSDAGDDELLRFLKRP